MRKRNSPQRRQAGQCLSAAIFFPGRRTARCILPGQRRSWGLMNELFLAFGVQSAWERRLSPPAALPRCGPRHGPRATGGVSESSEMSTYSRAQLRHRTGFTSEQRKGLVHILRAQVRSRIPGCAANSLQESFRVRRIAGYS